MSAPPRDHDAILNAIQQWPQAEQIRLAHEILQAHTQANPTPQTEGGADALGGSDGQDSWGRLVGALATGQPAPTDEEVERWREERRSARYER